MNADAEAPSGVPADSADRRLVERVAAGDESAFDELYVKYHGRLSRFLMNVCGRYNLVEEVINDAMLVVWQQAQTFRGDAAVSTWITSIAYRRALSSLKKFNTARKKEKEAGQQGTPSATPGDARERADWLSSGLEQLPLEQRLTLELAYFLGHSCADIATITDCPVNTVKTRLFKARKKLHRILPELAGGGELEGGFE